MDKNETYHSKYYEENKDRIKERQRKWYADMPKTKKKQLLSSLKQARDNETDEQRKERLAKAKERYQNNRDKRLEYQKQYALNKAKELADLKRKVKRLEKRKDWCYYKYMDIHTLLTVRDKISDKLSKIDKYDDINSSREVLTGLLNWVNEKADYAIKKMEDEHNEHNNS